MTDSIVGRRLCLAILSAVCLLSAPGIQAADSPQPGELAPDFLGSNVEGNSVSVSSYAGKVVVLSFWASWCGPCMKELPILEGIARTGESHVQVVAVNIEGLNTYRKIARKMAEMKLLVASDVKHKAQRAYGVDGIPHMVIIGKDGRIVSVHRGYDEDGLDEVVEDLNRALAQSLQVQPADQAASANP